MPDTGAPWNIPYVAASDLVSDWPQDSQDLAEAIADGLDAAGGFDTRVVITASDPSWPVPTLANPIVKVTVIGAGGGGGAGGTQTVAATAGGTTTFANGESFAISCTGGLAGGTTGSAGRAGRAGFASANGGMGGAQFTGSYEVTGTGGQGGEIKINYVDLTGETSLDLIIGAGGNGATGTAAGGAGGRGEIIIEYRAG